MPNLADPKSIASLYQLAKVYTRTSGTYITGIYYGGGGYPLTIQLNFVKCFSFCTFDHADVIDPAYKKRQGV